MLHTPLMESGDDFMRRAIAMASANVLSGRGGPFAALIVRGEEVIAEGVNLVTSTNDPTAHAEITAIRLACQRLASFQLTGCDLFTSCEPCPMCLGAIFWARPRHVYYSATHVQAAEAGFDDRFIYEQMGRMPGERGIPMERLLPDSGNEPFQQWLAFQQRILY